MVHLQYAIRLGIAGFDSECCIDINRVSSSVALRARVSLGPEVVESRARDGRCYCVVLLPVIPGRSVSLRPAMRWSGGSVKVGDATHSELTQFSAGARELVNAACMLAVLDHRVVRMLWMCRV